MCVYYIQINCSLYSCSKKDKFEQLFAPDTLTPQLEIPLYYMKDKPAESANMPKPISVCVIFSCQGVSADVMNRSDVYQHTHTHLLAEHLRTTYACGRDLKHRRGESLSQDFVSGKNREPPSGSVWPRQTVTPPSYVPALPYPHRKEEEREEPA